MPRDLSRASAQLLPLDPDLAERAHAEAGRLAEAVATAQRALELATAQTNLAELNPLRSQIELYRSGSPFRDTSQTNATPYSR